MSYSDPQAVTYPAPISLGPISLPRTSVGSDRSVYTSSDGTSMLTASTLYGKRTRHMLRLDYKKIAADIFQPAVNVERGMSVYLVCDRPKDGFTNAEALAVYTGLKSAMTASSDLLITKLLGGES